MRNLVVVNDPRDWPLAVDDCDVISSKTYLTDSRFQHLRGIRVFNLCRSYRYQSAGYYTSLLATARGHKPLPSITTIQDLKVPYLIREVAEELEPLIQQSLSAIRSKEFALSIYFGRNVAKRHNKLAEQLFKLFPAPLLRAQFLLHEKHRKWILQSIVPISASEIPQDHLPFVVEVAGDYFEGRKQYRSRRSTGHYDLAILRDSEEQMPPSNDGAIRRFIRAARAVGFAVEILGKDDYGRLPEFDALFIRVTTAVNHFSYRFARRAAAEGLVVVDDPESILKCTNKVFLEELLAGKGIPTPDTQIVHRGNAASLESRLGLPCILKRPDGSFSRGVTKVDSPEELEARVNGLLESSDLIIAQEFMATPFDWRVGIFDRRPLFVCKYFMARHHWQIIRHGVKGSRTWAGNVETLPVEDAPRRVVRLALRAANLIGDGFYGVDIKERRRKLYVIEVNDNPTVEAGAEDACLNQELYTSIMQIMLHRVECRKGHRGR